MDTLDEIKKIIAETIERLVNNGYSEEDAVTMTADVIRRSINRYYNNYSGLGIQTTPSFIPPEIKKYLETL